MVLIVGGGSHLALGLNVVRQSTTVNSDLLDHGEHTECSAVCPLRSICVLEATREGR